MDDSLNKLGVETSSYLEITAKIFHTMAEGKQGKAVTNAKKQGQGQQQDKSTHKTADKKELSEVPMLKYGQSTNNFIKFKEALSIAALISFGDVAKLIQLGSYYIIGMPEEADYEIPGNDKMSERMYEIACVEWVKEKTR
jgi:hypothetical protein